MAITKTNNNICFESVINMFGIDPLKFNFLHPECLPDYDDNGCEEYWEQYPSTNKIISREELAQELYRAELEVASYLEQFPFKTYISEDIDIDTLNNCLYLPTHIFKTAWKCVSDFGVYENVMLGTGNVTYVDNDNDGFKELAEITFDYTDIDTVFTPDDLILTHVGYDNYSKICSIISWEDDTENKLLTLYVDSWNMVKPELYINRSFVKKFALNACEDENYVEQVNISIKQKTCKPDGWLYTVNAGCTNGCEETAHPFCVTPLEKGSAYFKINIGSVDENGCFIYSNSCATGKPVRINVNYISGCNDCYNTDVNSLSFCKLVERAIIYIALARSQKVLCGCGCSNSFIEELQTDTSITDSSNGIKFNYPSRLRNLSPFGTKIGEIEAFKIINNIEENLC